MMSHTWISLLMVISLNRHLSHGSLLNFVKPGFENTTCPGDPCLTLQAYVDDADAYFVSDVTFAFLAGDHYYDANLRLKNITDIRFQSSNLSAELPVRIIFLPGANLTFIMSYNVTFSNLTFQISGSQTGTDEVFGSVNIRDSSVHLSNLNIIGSSSNLFASTAFSCVFSLIEVSDIQVTGAVSKAGAAFFTFMSTVTFSGNNSFVHNLASYYGSVIYSSSSNITLSGFNYFGDNAGYKVGGAIFAINTNLQLSGMAIFIHNGGMFGGAIALFNGTSLLQNDGSLHFSNNTAREDGGALLIFNSSAHMSGQVTVQQNIATSGTFTLVYSTAVCDGTSMFINNLGINGGAVSLYGSRMLLSKVKFESNHAVRLGGAIRLHKSNVTIIDSLMVNNSAIVLGGAISVTEGSSLLLMGDNFIEHNTVRLYGGGIQALMSVLSFTGNSYFTNNTSMAYGGALSLTLSNASVQGTLVFFNNSGNYGGGAVYGVSSTTQLFSPYAQVMFEHNVANKQGGAIYSIDSTWSLRGNITFHNNFAMMGGAMSLNDNSRLILNQYSKTVYSENHAGTNGGAIFVEDTISIKLCDMNEKIPAFCFTPNTSILQLCRLQDDCFIELNADLPFDADSSNINMIFQNNFAGESGTVIYGGSLDNCRLYLGGGIQDVCGNLIGRDYTENALPVVLDIFTIDNMSSAVSSEPFRVCFCDIDGIPDCEMNVTVATVRGRRFTLSAVTVGQGNNTVPSVIIANVEKNTRTTLSSVQRRQETGFTCTDIVFNLFSAETNVTMILYPDGPCRDTGIARRPVIVTFLPCPNGFRDVQEKCMCDERLGPFDANCNVDNETIERAENKFWMMAIYVNYSYQGLMIHQGRCPFDFCVEVAVEVNLKNPDIQCNHHHSGVLCGSCQTNFSLALGSLHCLSCSDAYLALIIVFAVAGIALVVLLLLLQLTVAHGTVNGFIFYVNVVQVNRDIFFPPGVTNILTIFIAWLNLDLGIETCFYAGMDAYAFIWLQFVFPFYVWFLIGFIIFLSRYSQRISRWLGDNPVGVLATLFLLSYSKILRTIIAALSYTYLEHPDGSYQRVWLYDGSVPYFQRPDHILLGTFSILALLFLFLPYTILLLCGHWIQAYSHWKIFSWINKLKPFMDTYHAPYKKECRYWTGFLLLVRCALFLTFAFNALGDASINLLTITTVTAVLTVLAWLQNRLYREVHKDILEASFILNLCIFAATTYYVREIGHQKQIAYSSIGIALATFIYIVFYHIFLRIRHTQCFELVSMSTLCKSLFKRLLQTDGTKTEEENGSISDIPLQSNGIRLTVTELREPLLEDDLQN